MCNIQNPVFVSDQTYMPLPLCIQQKTTEMLNYPDDRFNFTRVKTAAN